MVPQQLGINSCVLREVTPVKGDREFTFSDNSVHKAMHFDTEANSSLFTFLAGDNDLHEALGFHDVLSALGGFAKVNQQYDRAIVVDNPMVNRGVT